MNHCPAETSRHLFQTPLFRSADGRWHETFAQALDASPATLTLDPAALMGIVCFGYPCGDRTLLKEVTVSPWMSSISGAEGTPGLAEIPPHGFRGVTAQAGGEELFRRLCDEAEQAVAGYDKIAILLSGGLDSRIVAGVVAALKEQGRISQPVLAVTWGKENSRDVVYGQLVAERLGFAWRHFPLQAESVPEQIDRMVKLGAMVPPCHLHRMDGFEGIDGRTIALGGSYGDSVGRAEYSKRHLLRLGGYEFVNKMGLLSHGVIHDGQVWLEDDWQQMTRRAGDRPRYAIREVLQESQYMRRMLGHIMNVSINSDRTHLYQLFTSPEVYGYMWGLHPACRDDAVYAHVMELLPGRVARLPWSRTNRALSGATEQADRRAVKDYHEYHRWVRQDCWDALKEDLSPEWFAQTRLFNPTEIQRVVDTVRAGKGHQGHIDKVTYFVCFRRFWESLAARGKTLIAEPSRVTPEFLPSPRPGRLMGLVTSGSPVVNKLRDLRRHVALRKAVRESLKRYPVQD